MMCGGCEERRYLLSQGKVREATQSLLLETLELLKRQKQDDTKQVEDEDGKQ